MKRLFRYFVVFATVFVCIFAIGAVSVSANESMTEDVTAVEITDDVLSPFRLNQNSSYDFKQDGVKYELYQAELTVDFNGDGKCTAFEAREMLRISAGLEKYSGSIEAIDVSRDGKLSAVDARFVLRYSARMDVYYFAADGSTLSGFAENSDGKTCYFENNGVIATGLKTIDGILIHFGTDGTMSTGLVSANGGVYFFDEGGKPVSGDKTIDGKKYLFENGKAVTGLIQDGDTYHYYDTNGVMQTGTHVIDGETYIFDSLGDGYLYVKPKDPSEFKTAMIGDSIVATIGLYNVTEYIDFYGKVSLNSSTIFTKKISGSSRYVIDEIKDRGYDKVIILMGINEYGANVSAWKEQYRKIIEAVKVRAPGAEIYVHAILPVNDSRARANGYTVTNAIITPMNNALRELAKEEGCYYIDAREAIALSDGTLPYDAASDGIHPNYTYCDIWGDWLIEQICK